MQFPEQAPPQPHGSHALPAPRRSIRWRVLDWVIGAVAMLLILLLAGWWYWTSITEPVDDPRAPLPSVVATPTPGGPITEGAPPSDLADDEVWLGDIALSASRVFAAGTPLLDVVGSGTDVTSGRKGLVAKHLELTATVPFHVVAAQLAPGTTVSAADGGEVRVDTFVEVLGRKLAVGATGTVDVVRGKLVMVPTSIDLGIPKFITDFLGDSLLRLVTIEHEIEGLPDGVILRTVNVVDKGFRAHLTGDNVKLVQ
ncbi:MAG: LmeA family phospholipid-binding protein [Propionibacteriaceae bacterium]|nr:LmeA family phospholipid-binding protein [Propionibacteriaceae bacterium]